jgi:hypothetical protein
MYPNPSAVLPLPPRPNLEQYKKRAKNLVKACKSRDPREIHVWVTGWIDALAGMQASLTPEGRASFDRHVPQFEEYARRTLRDSPRGGAPCALSDAQLVIARVHGFNSWPQFAKHVEALAREDSPFSQFESAVDAVITGDVATLERLLRANPALIRVQSPRDHHATLLQYVAANGVERFRQKTPTNAVEVARLLLDAGAEVDAPNWPNGPAGPGTALGLVATSAHPERAGVQLPLMQALLDYGASIDGRPEGWNPLLAALHNGQPAAAEFLATRGARMDLEGAAGVGRLDVVKGFFNDDGTLKASTTSVQLTSGFMWACGYGRNHVVEFLLQNGFDLRTQDDDRQTGAHWAAIGGQLETIKLLLAHHAPLEVRNVYGSTVLGQALRSAAHDDRDIYVSIVETLIAGGAEVPERHPPVNKRVDELLSRYGSGSSSIT